MILLLKRFRLKKLVFTILILFIVAISSYAKGVDKDYYIVKDMRGTHVKIQKDLKRIATIDDGLVESVMTYLGVADKVTSIGSWSMKRRYKYESYASDNDNSTYHYGLNTALTLNPNLEELPCVNSPQGDIINYETLVKSKPELVILRVGDCTVRGGNQEHIDKTIATIEKLGLQLFVLYSPSYLKSSGTKSLKDEIYALGRIFNKSKEAEGLYKYLFSIEEMVRGRTEGVQAYDKSKMIYLGLSSSAISDGGVGLVSGDVADTFIIENIVNARNAYNGSTARVLFSAEQIYSIDPDVIILFTSNGFHTKEKLYNKKDYKKLNMLKAIKNKRVYSLAFNPMYCSIRLEYPIDMLIVAKASYPELFKDIKVHELILDFYKQVYSVDDATAKELRSNQILDWTVNDDF